MTPQQFFQEAEREFRTAPKREKASLRFGNPDDNQNCYACGCQDFDEDWDSDGLDWFINLFCSNCGAKQGWWYKKQYEEARSKKANKFTNFVNNQLRRALQ